MKVGDVVQLKSGSPPLHIVEISGDHVVLVEWISQEAFSPCVLTAWTEDLSYTDERDISSSAYV